MIHELLFFEDHSHVLVKGALIHLGALDGNESPTGRVRFRVLFELEKRTEQGGHMDSDVYSRTSTACLGATNGSFNITIGKLTAFPVGLDTTEGAMLSTYKVFALC